MCEFQRPIVIRTTIYLWFLPHTRPHGCVCGVVHVCVCVRPSTNKYSTHTQGGGFLGDLNGKVYGGMDRSIYILPYVPLRDQVSSLLTRQLVEEAVLLAETIAALEEAAKERSRQKRYYSESWSIVVIL